MWSKKESLDMRSFALKSVSIMVAILLSCSGVYAECKCTCKPSPPGGTTYCSSGIAVCGKGSGGGCEGRCESVSGTQSLDIAASALGAVVGGSISSDDLRRNRDQAKDAISTLLSSNGTTEVTVNFVGNSLSGTIGVNADVAESLREALNELSVSEIEIDNSDTLPQIPDIPSNATGSKLEQYRQRLEKYREELEKERKSKEINIEIYREGIEKYSEGIDQYKEAVKQIAPPPI
jgi:hypothetical protein